MLHVRVDMLPFGEEAEREQLSELWIGNLGGGYGGDFADYGIWTEDPRPGRLPDEPMPRPDAMVRGHYRPQGHRELLRAAFAAINRAGA